MGVGDRLKREGLVHYGIELRFGGRGHRSLRGVGADVAFEIAAADRMRLIEGLDDIGLTLKQMDDIVQWEQRAATAQPWLQTARDSR